MKLTRRQLLKRSTLLSGGAALSPLLLPFVEQARAEAEGAAPPRRVVFIVKSSGLTPAELVPQDMAKDWVKASDTPTWPDNLKSVEM